MTVKELKAIPANMSDDAMVLARDRDCISLCQVHVVGVEGPKRTVMDGHVVLGYVPDIEGVYGGRKQDFPDLKQAIIFCDND